MRTFLFHPFLLHFPIALYFLEMLLICLWMVKRKDDHRRFALLTFKLGYFFMIGAMVTGFIDAGGLSGIVGDVRSHAFGALGVFVIYTARAFYWRFALEEHKFSPTMHVAQTMAGNMLVAVTAYLGGILVYGR